MQKFQQTLNHIEFVLGPRARWAERMSRVLQREGYIEKYPGRYPKPMTPHETGMMLLAGLVVETSADISEIPEIWMELPLLGETDVPALKTLGSLLEAILTGHVDIGSGDGLTLSFHKQSTGFGAELEGRIWVDGKELVVNLPYFKDASWGGWWRDTSTVAGEGLAILRNLLNRDSDGPMMNVRLSSAELKVGETA